MKCPYLVLFFMGFIVSLVLCQPECPVYEAPKTMETSGKNFRFYFKPLPGFRNLEVSMIVDDAEWPSNLVIYPRDLGKDTVGNDGWLPVMVQHYRDKAKFWLDTLALKVTVGASGSVVRKLLTGNWLTNDYGGFKIYVKGNARVSIGCYPTENTMIPITTNAMTPNVMMPNSTLNTMPNTSSPILTQNMLERLIGGDWQTHRLLLVGGISGGVVLLLLMVIIIVFLVTIRRRKRNKSPTTTKQSSNNLMMMNYYGQMEADPEEPTYEEIDGDSLYRLRQKLDNNELDCPEEPTYEEFDEAVLAKLRAKVDDNIQGRHKDQFSENVYAHVRH